MSTLKIGRWTGNTITIAPTTTWSNPLGGTGTTEIRNDSSAYSWNSSSCQLLLPFSDLADGYLINASIEIIGAGGRQTTCTRWTQFLGTGNFASQPGQSYVRDGSNNNGFTNTWAFVDNPSGGSVFNLEWIRDTDSSFSSVGNVTIEVISLFYDDCAIFKASPTVMPGGIIPTSLTGFTEEKSATNVTLASDTFTIAHTTGKRYIALGGGFGSLESNSRTQRWTGLLVNGVIANEFKGYSYVRNLNNSFIGTTWSGLLRTIGSDVDLNIYSYRGNNTASGGGGADVDGSTVLTQGDFNFVLIELNDDTEVFRATNFSDTQPIAATGSTTCPVAANLNFNDATSFTITDNDNVNVVQDMDTLIMINASGASTNISSGLRGEVRMNVTLDGVEDTDLFDGNYIRGNQGGQDTFGWSGNLIGYVESNANQDLGLLATRTGNGHLFSLNSGWTSFNAINLDTMVPVTPPVTEKRYFIIS